MKNLLLFTLLQALRPVAMSLLVVFWSYSPWLYPSVAFVLENNEVLVRLGANALWFPVNSQPAVSEPLQAFLEMGDVWEPRQKQRRPYEGNHWELILVGLGAWWLLVFHRDPAPDSSWLFFTITHLTGRRDPEFTGLLGQASSQDPWE